MKSVYIGTLVPNEVVTGSFLVVNKEIKQKKSGEPYLSLMLSDRTGDIEAKMWDNVVEIMADFDRDDFVKVKGLAQSYQNRLQFTVHRLRRLEDNEVEFDDFFPCSDRPSGEMFTELQQIIAGIGNEHLRGLLNAIFADESIASRFKIAPAAKNIHHACRGGLLEHVLSLCHLCRSVGPHYKQVDTDLLLTGAILHDIGKVEELSYARSFGYSSEGQLLGHIVIGLRLVGEKFAAVPGFPPKLRTLVEHMILSHHGELEFGSPKTPVFAEALLLHHLDNLDSKMEAMRRALTRDPSADGEFTGWINALERTVLRKERYLDGRPPTVRPPATQSSENLPDRPLPPTESPVLAHSVHPHPVQTRGNDIPTPPEAPTPRTAPAQPAFSRTGQEPPTPLPARPSTLPTAAQPAVPKVERKADRPHSMTLFGEKLQAVLKPGTPVDHP